MATSTTYLSLIKPEELDTDKIRENFNTNMDTLDNRFSATYLAVQDKSSVTITGGSITSITDLVVADGGTGVSTLTNGGVLLGSGAEPITAMAVLADNEMIVGNGTTDPVAESGATLRTSIGVAIGSDVQAYDAGLLSIAALTTSANKMIYTTSSDTYTTTTLSAFARTILDDAAAGNVRTTIGAASRALDNISSCAINAALLLGTSNAYALGSTSKMWSDLFLASGAVINFNNGNVTITHSAGTLTFAAAGDFTSLTLDTALAILEGGTGQTAKTAAFDALSPVTTLGDIIYGNATVDNVRLAGNTTSTKKYLTQTGNGSISAAPIWGTIASGDIPDISGTYAVVAQTFYIGTTQIAINRSSGALTLAGLTLTTPDIGTPSAGTLTNCDGTASSLTAGAVTNATFTTALTINTGTLTLTANVANNSVLTIGAGAVSVSGSNTGDQTNITGNAATVTVDATTSDTTCFVAIFESASGSLEPQTDATLTYNANTGLLSSTLFAGNITGTLTGNADTVTSFTPAGGSLTLAGADALTITTGGTTNVTLPTGTSTLVNTSVSTLSSLTSVGTITTGGLGSGAVLAAVTMTLDSDADNDIYYRSSNVLTRLASNSNADNRFLRTISSGAPSWQLLVAGDIPDISATYSPVAGSGSIVTVGTISSGIWQGTDVGPEHGGTGVSNGSNNIITFTGNYTLGLTLTANTSITLPTSGIVVSNTNACTNIEGSYLSVTTGTLNVSGLQTTLTNEAGLYAALSDVSDFVQAAEVNSIDSAMYVDASIDHEHLAPDVISGMTDVTSEDADYMLIWDNTDSALKKVDMGEVRGAAGGTVDTSGTPVDNDFAKFTDADTIEGRDAGEVKTDLGYMTDLVDDTDPDLGGELDAGAHSIGFTLQTATGDGATLIDWTAGNYMKFTFGAQNETITFTNPTNPGYYQMIIVQDGTGSRKITWSGMTIKWYGGTKPTLTTTANGEDRINFIWDGTSYYGQADLAFAAPAWLSGWDKRIKLDIADYAGDIGASVTWFPVTVFLTATQGEEVFVELTTDAEYPKVAFTKADGTTELYGECELFDVSEELGIYHVSRDGWTINANTSIYMYYDKDHANNNTYIGAITARTEVWDGNFKFVCHMVDDNGNVDDSTSNNNDGTKKGANEPNEVAGKVGQGQHFDGADDYISIDPLLNDIATELSGTISFFAKIDVDDGLENDIFTMSYDAGAGGAEFRVVYDMRTGTQSDAFYAGMPGWKCFTPDDSLDAYVGNWLHVTITHNGTEAKIYLDGVSQSLTWTVETDKDRWFKYVLTDAGTPADTINIGMLERDGADLAPFDGLADEVCVSIVERSAAWVKGSYNSGNDSLFTYGSEETS